MATAIAIHRASQSLDVAWMRRVSLGAMWAMWAFTAGVTLATIGRRVGGGAGDRVAASALSVVHMAVWTLLVVPLAVTLLAMRETVSALDSDSDEEPAPRVSDAAARRRAVWQAMMKDF